MGNTGCQMGGWFRKEINTVEDFKGLKMRIGGWAGKTLGKLGLVPQQIAGGDIYPALEKGTIDAAEWVGPYDDEKLGFYKVAKYYYYPGWWEGGTTNHLQINSRSGTACRRTIRRSCARPRAPPTSRNWRATMPAIRRRSSVWSPRHAAAAVLAGDHGSLLKASNEVNAETSATNADFKKVSTSMNAFRADAYLWWQVAEYGYDTFMIRNRAKL